jgi:hypothetical protein
MLVIPNSEGWADLKLIYNADESHRKAAVALP